ncbi:probable disease resistance protein At5g66900 [Brassica napus]|uniref:probable disease resistance protein At5g66900 n=1 Tax=Brassica napus TaxID=3708 RepID=UPI0006AB0887|nr:probable disease resistance protein At5g66900 [Brassica napus]
MSEMIGGAVVAEGLKQLIAEAKKFKNFKPLSKELISTMEELVPLTETINCLQNQQNLDAGELKGLMERIEKAKIVVRKCQDVPFLKRSLATREIEQVNKDMLNYCQIVIQLIQSKNQLQSMEANNNNFQTVFKKLDQLSAPAPAFRQLCSVPELKTAPVGFALPLMMLKKKLLDAAVVRLVVSAPAGCGKTTLVRHLCHDQDIKRKFQHIFYSVVSSTPNFRKIVQRLLEHNGHQAPTFDNDTQAANVLKTLLEELDGNDQILLVLDDVWSAGAPSFLENFPTDIPNLKILLTSRFNSLDFGDTFKLEPLKKEHAKTLLIQYASRPDHASDAEYERLFQKILERCAGFPLLIKVIGGSLRKQSLNQWQGQVIEWSGGGSVLNSREVIERLKPSFDALDSNLKQCFLDMGLFLEDQVIRAWMITDIWAELYGGNGKTEKDKIIVSVKYLEDLASHNLLDLVPLGKKEHEDGFYNDFLVTQHDILRELAINQNKSEAILELKRKRLTLEIRDNRFPDWCLNSIHPVVVNASLLSIFTDNEFSSPWFEMDCPNVEALVLNISSSNYALPSFIATMKKLKVVIIINHGPGPATLTNLSCLSSLPKLKRIRLEKVAITFLDILQLQLVSLKKMFFVMCSFGEVSNDKNEIDVSKALSSLQEIDIDYCYDLEKLPNWISEAVSLQSLSITNCHKLSTLPEAIGNLSKLELLRLSSCINLTELPETIVRLSNLQFLDISDCLGLRKLPVEIGRLKKLKKISMNKCWKCELPDSVKNLENLEVKCDEETAVVLWKGLEQKMINLKVQVEEREHNLNLLRLL